jgi:hypothetical protein
VLMYDDCAIVFTEAGAQHKLWVRIKVAVGVTRKQMFAKYVSVLDGGARLIEHPEVGHGSPRVGATRLYDAERSDINSIWQIAGLESVTQCIGRLSHI